MSDCTSCGARLASALVCESCGALQDVRAADPWAVFGLEPGYEVDRAALKKRLLALQRRMHPDFFGAATAEQRELAERNTAELNGAYHALADDARRAELVLEHLGGPDEQSEREMPRAFLLEVLEWNEALEEARSAPPGARARAALADLERALCDQRAAALARVAALLVPLPPAGAAVLTDLRKELNAVRYFDRTLQAISELRLSQARSTA